MNSHLISLEVSLCVFQLLRAEKTSCPEHGTRNTTREQCKYDKYSFTFTKVEGSSDSFPVLKTFAAYFRPSPQALSITKHTKTHMEVLSPLAKGISMSENLKLKMGFSYF